MSVIMAEAKQFYFDKMIDLVHVLNNDLNDFKEKCESRSFCCQSCCKMSDEYSNRIKIIMNGVEVINNNLSEYGKDRIGSPITSVENKINFLSKKIHGLKESCLSNKINIIKERGQGLIQESVNYLGTFFYE